MKKESNKFCLQLNPKFRIVLDPMNIELQTWRSEICERGRFKGREINKWETIGFMSDLNHVFEKIAHLQITTSADYKEFKLMIEELKALIKDSIPKLNQINLWEKLNSE